MSEQSFHKTSRLLNAADYKAVFDRARYKVSCREFLFLATDTERPRPRLGLVIAKKHVPKAVHRNRLKRALREVFRTQQASLPSLDIVVLARKDADRLTPADLAAALNKLINDLIDREAKDKARRQHRESTSASSSA